MGFYYNDVLSPVSLISKNVVFLNIDSLLSDIMDVIKKVYKTCWEFLI